MNIWLTSCLIILMHSKCCSSWKNIVNSTSWIINGHKVPFPIPDECYTCRSEGLDSACGDPFKLHGFSQFVKKCPTGWCMKLIVDPDDNPHTHVQGFVQRKCWLKGPTFDGKERCGEKIKIAGTNIIARGCFCKGRKCNDGNKPESSIILTFILIFYLLFIE